MSASAGDRVLIVVQNLPVPFDRRVWMEATTLASAGKRVSVISPKLKGFNRSHERIENVSVYRYSMPFDPRTKLGFVAEYVYGLLRTFLISIRVAATTGFDIVHACNPPETYWALGLFWRLFGKRYIFDHHDLSPELYQVKFPSETGMVLRFLKFMEWANFKVASVVIAPNESHKAIAIERGHVKEKDVFIVRSGPSPTRFTSYPPDPAWKKGKPYLIAYLGEMGQQDGVDGLVEAVAFLKHEMHRNDFHAVFIGGGTYRDDAIALAGRLGVEDDTTFTGVVSDDDLCRILSSADIGVDPVPRSAWSDRSTMNKVIEYMYFGLPVVAFDLHETRVSAGEAGVFADDSAAGLAKTIEALIDDPERRARMSEFARRRFHEDLAWERSIPALLAAYQRVAEAT
jgi:glycosyltransferase involved in cell wall biosynthesis